LESLPEIEKLDPSFGMMTGMTLRLDGGAEIPYH
jgi:hypothetical protein